MPLTFVIRSGRADYQRLHDVAALGEASGKAERQLSPIDSKARCSIKASMKTRTLAERLRWLV